MLAVMVGPVALAMPVVVGLVVLMAQVQSGVPVLAQAELGQEVAGLVGAPLVVSAQQQPVVPAGLGSAAAGRVRVARPRSQLGRGPAIRLGLEVVVGQRTIPLQQLLA
jgi:hypothetical protein